MSYYRLLLSSKLTAYMEKLAHESWMLMEALTAITTIKLIFSDNSLDLEG